MKFHPLFDESLNLRFKNGDVSAFKQLYNNSKEILYANIFKLVKDEDTAADITQDVFIEVWNKRENFDPEKSFHHLLFHIAKHKTYDYFRKASRDQKLRDKLILSYNNHKHILVDDVYILNEDIEKLNREIDALPDKCREVFKLCKIEGKSYQEVAYHLNISTATVNNHIVKATKLLKEKLNKGDSIPNIALFILFLILK